ncbi:MAG: site-specific integrase [Pseudomonadota bacterium]
MQVRLRGIHKVRRKQADGTERVHYYHRATKTKLEGPPNSPAFLASYAAAEKLRTDYLGQTFAQLVRKFEQSPEFLKTAEATQREYQRKFRVIDVQWGTCPIPALTDLEFRRDVLTWRDRMALTKPREADNLVSAMARVLAFAVDRGEIKANVLGHFSRAYHSNRADKIWLPKHVEAFTEVASPELVTAMTLALHTGQRQGDLLRLRWSDYDGKVISLRQSKTGANVTVPCTQVLRTLLDRLERRAETILTTPSGIAWTSDYFKHQWASACKKAEGLKDLHFHDLRGTAITMLAEAGCTVPEIAAITGHRLDHVGRILEAYLSRTQTLSRSAIDKLDRHLERAGQKPRTE